MSFLDHHLVRRSQLVALQLRDAVHRPADRGHDVAGDMTGTLPLLAVAAIAWTVLAVLVHYIYGLVVATLAAVEDPQPARYLPVHTAGDDDDGDDKKMSSGSGAPPQGVPVAVVPPRAITSSLRATVRHLRARAGPLGPFRGLGLYGLWSLARAALVHVVVRGAGPDRYVVRALAAVAAEVALAGLALVWIHTVIAEPRTPIPGLSRLLRAAWSRFAPAVALRAAAGQLGLVLPALLAGLLRLFRLDDHGLWSAYPDPSSTGAEPGRGPAPAPAPGMGTGTETGAPRVLGGLLLVVLSLAAVVLVEIPAAVVMVRVGASLLPEHVDTVVPVDRSFGGRVVPTRDGGRGTLGLVDAWTSFSGAARVRLMKVLLKVVAILTLTYLPLVALFAAVLMTR